MTDDITADTEEVLTVEEMAARMDKIRHIMSQPCKRCHGAVWCWCDELDDRAGHDPTALVVDDTRYTCPDCDGSGAVISEG